MFLQNMFHSINYRCALRCLIVITYIKSSCCPVSHVVKALSWVLLLIL